VGLVFEMEDGNIATLEDYGIILLDNTGSGNCWPYCSYQLVQNFI